MQSTCFEQEFLSFPLLHQPPEYLHATSVLFLQNVFNAAEEVAEAVHKTPSAPDPKEQGPASEKREGARAATKPSTDAYCIKRHKRKIYPTATAPPTARTRSR